VPVLSYLNILIRHSDVISVGGQIFWRSHHSELDGSLVAKGLVCPFSHGSDLFDSRNTVVRNEDLERTLSAKSCAFHFLCHAYRSNDGVPIALCDKVLDSAGGRCAQFAAPDEV
jgi:hypothetical protein